MGRLQALLAVIRFLLLTACVALLQRGLDWAAAYRQKALRQLH